MPSSDQAQESVAPHPGVRNLAAERRPRRAPEAMSAIPKSWKPSRCGRSGSLYCLIGDIVSQEIAFVTLIKVFVAIVHRGASIFSSAAIRRGIVTLGRKKCESRLVFLIFLAAYRDRSAAASIAWPELISATETCVSPDAAPWPNIACDDLDEAMCSLTKGGRSRTIFAKSYAQRD
jgi:hypothetical protein